MINSFRGDYGFLSNFHYSKIEIEGITFLSGEAAFQSFKDLDKQISFAKLTPAEAKRKGKSVSLRADWEDVKIRIMYDVTLAKFEQNEDLKQLLLLTGDKQLVEGNYWNDTCWGVCGGVGSNLLGEILMIVREQLQGGDR